MALSSHHVARVLVTDDDDGVRALVDGLLADEGFAVSTAPTAWVALEMLEKAEFDLMVTDLALPEGLNGLELVRYARIRCPSLKSLFISGCPDVIRDDPDHDDFVSKPFRCGELLGCVWELLNRELPKKRMAPNPSRAAELAILEAKIECLNRQRRGPLLPARSLPDIARH
jgi:DNA-binding response OmpR family regulator